MTHRLRSGADVGAELVRIVRDDLASALRLLGDTGPLQIRIHLVRLSLKWVRSILRILEKEFGEDAAAMRFQAAAAARLLSGARDADVAAASARVLLTTAGLAAEAGFGPVAEALDREAVEAHRRRAPLAEVRRELTAIAEEASCFSTDFDGAALLNAAVRRAYRRGRQAMRAAGKGRGTAELHAWRKEAKHLWHLLRMARELIPRRTAKYAANLDRLTELLGLDHDHAMLAEKLARSPHDKSLHCQLALIAQRRSGMEDESFALGTRLFAFKPSEFARRFAIAARSK
jgi:CHAD domain-containing protein